MTFRIVATLAMGLALAGCGGNPFVDEDGEGGGDGGGEVTDPIPEALRMNVQSVTYDGTTLTARIDGFASNEPITTFQRAEAFDVNGFNAYTYRETSSNRLFVALVSNSQGDDGTATVIGSGQFTEMVWGARYQANTAFDAPTDGGLATYSGRYVGLLNVGTNAGGPGFPNNPIRPARVEGTTLLNADFNNMQVEGSIYGREVVELAEDDPNKQLENIFLQITAIEPDGSFAGNLVFDDREAAGTAGGTFVGEDGTGVVGATELTPIRTNRDVLEIGVFSADRCASGDPPPCPQPSIPAP